MNQPWPVVPLGNLLIRSEQTIGADPEMVYKQVTVRLWGKGVGLRDQVLGSEISGSKRYQVKSGQFILSKIDARNGAFGLVPPALDRAVVSGDFPVFDINLDRLEPKYLEWKSKTGEFVDLCRAASEGTTNRVRLKEGKFLRLSISLPPLPEQRRIVAKIEALAAKIEEAKRLRDANKSMISALFPLLTRQILKNCKECKIIPLKEACAEIIDCLHSNPIYADDGIPTVRSPDIGWGELNIKDALRTSEEEYYRRTCRAEPQEGDIILVREGGGTGKAGIVGQSQKFSLGQRVMMLRPKVDRVVPKFLLYQWLSPLIFHDQIIEKLKGSASPHLNIKTLKLFTFILPPIEDQRRIVAYLDGLQAQVDALKKLQTQTAAELDALLPAILDRAFKGEL